ncbi:uncharacterized protein LOC106011667 [Aplysia californica]|uniref:Uncharacterized protein LOC106011667 n=1 Tax=Aplysia californica TaxID=6500 RepID=A0ABM0ZZ71_APLCA|nr:uncharacterized protein LOC106011667 [Aplysia californica]
MVILKPIDIFRDVRCAAGKVAGKLNLSNGVLIAEQGARFLQIWRDLWSTYGGTSWNSHSVLLLTSLAKRHPDLITVLGPVFIKFGPAKSDQHRMYEENCSLWKSFAAHLYKREIPQNADFHFVKTVNTTFGRIARFVLFGDSRICPAAENVF